MKRILFSILLIVSFITYGQETYKTKYKIKTSIVFDCDADDVKANPNCKEDTKELKRIKKVSYQDLPLADKKKIRDQYREILSPKTEKIHITKKIGEESIKTTYKTSNFPKTPTDLEMDEIITELTTGKKFDTEVKYLDIKRSSQFTKGYAKLVEDKLYINPWLKRDNDNRIHDREVYYFELDNRQTVYLSFQEISFSAIVIPIKYRFNVKKNGTEISEEFSTSVNANLFTGYSWGGTYFHHREKVGNKENTWKITPGVFIGTSTVELNAANTYTNGNEEKLVEDETLKKGLLSLGIGVGGSFNKLTANLLGGWDYAIGDKSQIWGYNGNFYIGFGVGYSLFKI